MKIYKVNKSRYHFLLVAGILASISYLAIYVTKTPVIAKILVSCLSMYILYGCYILVLVYRKSKNMLLKISSYGETFSFGIENDMKHYSKKNISSATLYGSRGNRGPNIMAIMKIEFNDGDVIRFPGMLILPADFLSVFHEYYPVQKLNPRELIRERKAFTK